MTDSELSTHVLHRLTSYVPDREWDVALDDPRLVHDLVTNDIGRLPWFYKRYQRELPRIALPRDLPTTSTPALEVLAGTAEATGKEPSLEHLARLLFLSAGVVRTMERPYATWLFRAAGSAGGRFPLELYVAVPEGSRLPVGVHWYDPHGHALARVGPPPKGRVPAVVVTGVPWRTGWRYRERGYRHVYWDAGTMLSQLLVAADSAGLQAKLYSRFPDGTLASLVGADRVHEFPVALIGLGEVTPAITPSGLAVTGEVDEAPLEFPLITEAQRAGEMGRLDGAWERGDAVPVAATGSGTVDEVILARGSQRRMDPSRGLSADVLHACMQVAMRGIDIPHWVAVHDVEDVAPGLYRWPELSVPIRKGNLRDELYRVCLDQDLARDASFVVIGATSIGAVDDRSYREVQLGAGLVEGRLHLAAYALGAGASGMTFIDSEIPALLGEELDALLFTCVGVPAYRSKRGGRPGRPTEVGRVRPRTG